MWHPGRRGSCCAEKGLPKERCLCLLLAPTPRLNPELEEELGFAAPLSWLAELALRAAEDGGNVLLRCHKLFSFQLLWVHAPAGLCPSTVYL